MGKLSVVWISFSLFSLDGIASWSTNKISRGRNVPTFKPTVLGTLWNAFPNVPSFPFPEFAKMMSNCWISAFLFCHRQHHDSNPSRSDQTWRVLQLWTFFSLRPSGVLPPRLLIQENICFTILWGITSASYVQHCKLLKNWIKWGININYVSRGLLIYLWY